MASRKRDRTDGIPSSSTPSPPSATIGPDVQSSQTLVPMLESLFRGQFIIMHSLRELAHNRPIIPMEHLLEQVAWPGAQPPLVRPNEAAPLEPTSARVEPVPADPYVRQVASDILRRGVELRYCKLFPQLKFYFNFNASSKFP